jgi:hypothetical protein
MTGNTRGKMITLTTRSNEQVTIVKKNLAQAYELLYTDQLEFVEYQKLISFLVACQYDL